MEVRIWVDKGCGSTCRVGERISIYFSISDDAYVRVEDEFPDGSVKTLYSSGDKTLSAGTYTIQGTVGEPTGYRIFRITAMAGFGCVPEAAEAQASDGCVIFPHDECRIEVASGAPMPQVSVDAGFAYRSPQIDGAIGDVEWADAYRSRETFYSPVGTPHDATIYLMNDCDYLYVAIDSGMEPGWYSLAFVYIDGNHNHLMDGSSSEPHVDVAMGSASPGGWPGANAYYYLYGGSEFKAGKTSFPAGASSASSLKDGLVTYEFKIPLRDLGASPGDTVGLSLLIQDESDEYNWPVAHETAGRDWADLHLHPCVERPKADLRIVSVHPVQVLYGARLITNKNTLFRVKVSSTFTQDVQAKIRLYLKPGDWDFSGNSYDPSTGIYEMDVQIPANSISHMMIPRREDLPLHECGRQARHLDAPRPLSKDATYSVEIVPSKEIEDIDAGNNLVEKTVHTDRTSSLRILYVPVFWNWEQPRPVRIPRADRDACDVSSFVLGVYPVSDVGLDYNVREAYIATPTDQRGNPVTSRQQWDSLPCCTKIDNLHRLLRDLADMGSLAGYDRTVGLIRWGWLGDYWRCRDLLWPISGCEIDMTNTVGVADTQNVRGAVLAEMGASAPLFVAHEFGHTYAWPGVEIYGQQPGVCTHRNDEGFWVNEWGNGRDPIADDSCWFFMERGDCNPNLYWIDRDHYEELYRSGFALDDPEVVLIRGVIYRNGSVVLDPFYLIAAQRPDYFPDGQGNYSVVFLDGAGEEVGRVRFNVTFSMYVEPAGFIQFDMTTIVFRLAWVNGTGEIQIRDSGERVLASRRVSPNPPSVRVTFPNGGEALSTSSLTDYIVSWEASDPDGDTLTFTILFSDDNGATWLPIATDMADTRYMLQADALLPGEQYLIKVIASDGVNTGQDVSDSAFSVVVTNDSYSVQAIVTGLPQGLVTVVSVDGTPVHEMGGGGIRMFAFYSGTTHNISVNQAVYETTNTRYYAENNSRIVSSPGYQNFSYTKQYFLEVRSDFGEVSGRGWHGAGENATFSVASEVPMSGVLGLLSGVHRFEGWTGDSQARTATAQITMDGPKSVVAIMRPDYTKPIVTVFVVMLVAATPVFFLLYGRRTKRRRAQMPTPPTPPPPPPQPQAMQ